MVAVHLGVRSQLFQQACLSLMVITGLLSIMPTLAQADDREDAISLFETVSVPYIQTLEGAIEQSQEERATYLPFTTKMMEGYLLAEEKANKTKDPVLQSMAYVTGALIYWMNDDDASTCFLLTDTNFTIDLPSPNGDVINEVFKQIKLKEIHARLFKAAGCASKDQTYWGKKSVITFNVMADMLTPGADRALDNISKANEKYDMCSMANKLAGDTYHGRTVISDKAGDGCIAISYIANNKVEEGCGYIIRAWQGINSDASSNSYDEDEQKVKPNLEKLSAALDCVKRVKDYEAEEEARMANVRYSTEAPVEEDTSLHGDDLMMQEGLQWFESGNALHERARLYSDGGDSEGACQSYYEAEKAYKNAAEAYGKVGDKFRASHNHQAAITSKDNSIADGQVECEAAGLKMYWIY